MANAKKVKRVVHVKSTYMSPNSIHFIVWIETNDILTPPPPPPKKKKVSLTRSWQVNQT